MDCEKHDGDSEEFQIHPSRIAAQSDTRVKLTAPKSGRSVVVRINDRRPGLKGRDLDLSEAAAIKLGVHEEGVAAIDAPLAN